MPTKGERTKAHIVATAAPIFNERGFVGTSLNDILAATGLEKGGIYRHFESKDELAVAAFDYAVKMLQARQRRALEKAGTALERLYACIDVFGSSLTQPALRGGCPMLNTAIDADDTHPALRERARRAVAQWQQLIVDIAEEARANGELGAATNPDVLASVITSSLEGAIMISRLLRDARHMDRVVAHLRAVLKSYETPTSAVVAR